MNKIRPAIHHHLTSFVILISGILFALVAIHAYWSNQPKALTHASYADAIVTSQGTYLDLTEIGAKLALGNSINDAVYAPFEVAPTDGSQVFGISSQSLMNIETGTACSAASGALGLIIATTKPTVITGAHSTAQLAVDNHSVFKFGNTFIRYVPPQNPGCAIGQVTPDMVRSKQSAFAQSFASLQPDN